MLKTCQCFLESQVPWFPRIVVPQDVWLFQKKETIPKAYQQLSNPLLCGEDLHHQIEIYSLCYFKNNDNLIKPYSFTDDEDDNEGDIEHNEAEEERHNDENRDKDDPRKSKSPVNSFSSWLFLLVSKRWKLWSKDPKTGYFPLVGHFPDSCELLLEHT